jgi:hypothetical protein
MTLCRRSTRGCAEPGQLLLMSVVLRLAPVRYDCTLVPTMQSYADLVLPTRPCDRGS